MYQYRNRAFFPLLENVCMFVLFSALGRIDKVMKNALYGLSHGS
jgi:hypothetical protein